MVWDGIFLSLDKKAWSSLEEILEWHSPLLALEVFHLICLGMEGQKNVPTVLVSTHSKCCEVSLGLPFLLE